MGSIPGDGNGTRSFSASGDFWGKQISNLGFSGTFNYMVNSVQISL